MSYKLEDTASNTVKWINENISKNKYILEVGCGRLKTTKKLAELGYTNLWVTGTNEEITCVQDEIISLPIYLEFSFEPKQKYDVIMCNYILNKRGTSESKDVCDIVYRALKYGGYAVLKIEKPASVRQVEVAELLTFLGDRWEIIHSEECLNSVEIIAKKL